ncbi:LysE family transporter [[Eubacterium] cellulosolvens]
MILESLALISVGVLVGLSGAAIPGPLLAFTLFDTSRKARVTGHYIIMGHVLWEFGVILLILFGFGWIILGYSPIIFVAGGFVLSFMGIKMINSRAGEVKMEEAKVNSSLGGGIFYTAFNPTQPVWWATAGLALLLKGLEVMGMLGVVLVTMGHWLADFGYYVFVSFVVHRHASFVNPRQRKISILLGLFVAALGIYFLEQGIEKLFF